MDTEFHTMNNLFEQLGLALKTLSASTKLFPKMYL